MILATGHQMIPQRTVVDMLAAVDFKSHLSGPTRTGNQNLLPTQIKHTCVKIPQLIGMLTCCGITQNSHRFRTLNLQHPGTGIGHSNIQTLGKSQQPRFKFTVGNHIPESIFRQPYDHTIHQYAALRRTSNGIASTPAFKVVDSAC